MAHSSGVAAKAISSGPVQSSLVSVAEGYVPFTDDFNRANENLDVSPDWTLVGGGINTAAVVSNQLDITGTAEKLYQCPDQGSARHYTQVLRTSGVSHQFFDCCVRATDEDNYIGLRAQGGNMQIFKKVAGVFTQLGGNYATALSATDVFRLDCDSFDNITAYLNGTPVIGPVVDAFNSAETRQGFATRVDTAAPAFDNFEAGLL